MQRKHCACELSAETHSDSSATSSRSSRRSSCVINNSQVNAGSQIAPTRLGLNGGDAYLLCHGGLQLGGANIANYAAVNRCLGLAAGARSLTGRAIGVAGPIVARGAARFLAEHIELPLAGEAAGCGD